MQLEEEVLDQAAPAQVAPAPAQQDPPGLRRRKQLHELLVKEHFDVPEDFNTFDQKLNEKPERLEKLHQTLVADKFDVPADYKTFSEKLDEGLKKNQPTPVERASYWKRFFTWVACWWDAEPLSDFERAKRNWLAHHAG